jgi:hypothetical protein
MNPRRFKKKVFCDRRGRAEEIMEIFYAPEEIVQLVGAASRLRE